MSDDDLKNEDRLASHVAKLVDVAEQYSDEQQDDRERALEYYDGKMDDLPAEEGRSQTVSKDVRSVIKKLMPSTLRTLLSNDKVVEYAPAGPGDEDAAAQATDYVNHVVINECGAKTAIYDAVSDAFLLKTGILKWSAYKRQKLTTHEFTNQPSSALLGLEGEKGIEIVDRVEYEETDPEVLDLDPDARRYDFKLRRMEEQIDIRLEAIPRGSFLIYPGSGNIDDSPLVGERQIVTRSELVSQGHDKDLVDSISAHDGKSEDSDDENAREGDDRTDLHGQTSKAMEEVLIYEVYVRLDLDEDGIAELYKICLAETGSTEETKHVVLSQEAVDEAPYADVVAEREAHQFEGHSVAEDVMDIQRIKTALLRETLDNIYWQNNKQPALDPSKLTTEGLEAVTNPAFGKPIILKSGANVNEAIDWMEVPFVADKSFAMMNYLDEEARDRTGITDSSGGVNPELLQDMTKFAAALVSESGIAQAAMIIDSLSGNGASDGGGIRKAFKGLLKLVIAHTDKPRTIRLRKEWVEYDPRHWNVDMDCTVNVGLGAGSKERDLAVLQLILGLQKELLATIGPDNPYVKPEQLYNVLEKITETAGFPSADPYFTEPNPEEIKTKLQGGGENGPSETEQKIQAQMAIEQVKADARSQVEHAQMEADIRVEQFKAHMTSEIEKMKAEASQAVTELRLEVDLFKHTDKMQLEREKLGLAPVQIDRPLNGDLFDVAG